MPLDIRTTGCCALQELDNISQEPSPQDVVRALLASTSRRVPFYLFSGVGRVKSGSEKSNHREYRAGVDMGSQLGSA